MATSNTRFTQNSLGQSKNPIDSDHGIYRHIRGSLHMQPSLPSPAPDRATTNYRKLQTELSHQVPSSTRL